jgi:hypothetical protein
MGGRSSFMAAQIRGDEKSGTAAQTPSLIAMRATPGSVVPDGRPTGLDLQDILGPAQRIKSIRSGKEASVDFESTARPDHSGSYPECLK